MKSMNDFVELYVSVDTLLLCDVMQMFRSMCMTDYGIKPFHFVSLPGFSNMCCLKLTRVQLRLLTHPDLYGYFERGIRGGCSFIAHRYFKSNNVYMGDEYDPTKETGYLLYYDVNSLYATCMTEPLAVGNFEFLERDEFDSIDWMSVPYDGYYGYAIECDLTIPPHLHDFFSSFPPAPMHRNIPLSEFSPYCEDILQELGLSKTKSSGKKLFCTLYDKNNYIVHFETLKCYLRLGMRVKHIHTVVRFAQEAWMKPYIDVNTHKRKLATDSASKDFYKLLSNACYGKQIENCRKYKDIRLVNDANILTKYYEDDCYYSNNLTAVSFALEVVKSTQLSDVDGPCTIQLSSYNFAMPLPKEMKTEKQRQDFNDILDGYYIAALRDGIEMRIKENKCPCSGCEIDHPSQREHTCLYPKSYSSEVAWYFDEVLKSLSHEDLFRKAKDSFTNHVNTVANYDPTPFHEDETWVRENYLTSERLGKWVITLKIIMD
ncbi:uncharacterized protein LOC124278400 [Haliotis rubra]|uniref:uncharacterized protein LOC124278400 n=1 Tax=Haliotis rubra TaxID=36100 RepID=UPI001EE50826|nr:uncharacterized protein LOC124278400 [Haliotis rubra]